MTDDSGTPLKIRTELREKLAQHFNREELRTLCFDLGIQYEDLPDSLEGMARDLVAHCERDVTIPKLLSLCRKRRPNVTWPQWPPLTEKVKSRVPEILRDPIWQGIGAVIAILALVFAIITWGVPALNPLAKPTATLSPSPSFTPMPTATSTLTLTPAPTQTPTHTSTPNPSPTPTPAVVGSAAVALQTWSGMYVTVTDITTTGKLKATATLIGEPQRFTWLCLANGKIALQIFDKFVSALNDEDDRNWELRAVATERLAWEEFTLLNPDTQKELPCNQALEQLKRGEVSLAFRTFHNRFVTAMGQDADWVLRAETTVLDKYEKFTAINLSVCPTQRDYRCLQGTMTPVATGASDMYCAETVTLPQPTLAYTVYISMTKRALENFGYSLYEVEAYGPGNSQTNLLREGTVAASSTEDGRYIAPYAIDGNLLTRWASAKCCNSGICPKDDKGNLICDNPDGQDPQWLKITLPKPAIIDRIVLKWERAYAVEYCVIINP
jgi:hypothetical protein